MEFLALLEQLGHTFPTLLDLTLTFPLLIFAMKRHRQLAGMDGVEGPFSVKLVFDNVWRTIPFVDTPWQIDMVRERGAPVIQDDHICIPARVTDFFEYPERADGDDGAMTAPDGLGGGELVVVIEAMASLGVPIGGLAYDELLTLIESWQRAAATAGGKPDPA